MINLLITEAYEEAAEDAFPGTNPMSGDGSRRRLVVNRDDYSRSAKEAKSANVVGGGCIPPWCSRRSASAPYLSPTAGGRGDASHMHAAGFEQAACITRTVAETPTPLVLASASRSFYKYTLVLV